jgi:hypothetical protein
MNKNKDKNEKIVIDVVKDKFSPSEISKLAQCIDEIGQNSSDRHIIWKDDKTTANEKIVISIQNGTLSVEELQKLSQCIRYIEQNKPIRHINVWMYTPDKTVKELQEVNDSITPGFPIKGVIEFNKIKK